MITIAAIRAREVLDSRGRPTVEADISLSDGTEASASVPSGASTGRHEAVELRDGDVGRYRGLGVKNAVRNIAEVIAPQLVGTHADLESVDARLVELDGTESKSHLGANATLAVSLATARAIATSRGQQLWQYFARGRDVVMPLPMVNILSGGLHAGRQIDFQDFLAIPLGTRTYREALRRVVEVHFAMGELLTDKGYSTLKADEGGYGPTVPNADAALQLMDQAVTLAGFEPGVDIVYALDVAATHFYDTEAGGYRLAGESDLRTSAEIVDLLADLSERYAIASIEDGLAEDDWAGWYALNERLGGRIQIVGDDLFTTNIARLRRGITEDSANAVLVKMNQIGTLSETIAVVDEAHGAGFRTVISARSGETEDSALADIAVGLSGRQIKIGSVTQGERLAKYNRLLRIEEHLGDRAVLAQDVHR